MGKVPHVAAAQPSRLLLEAVDPLQAGSLHPMGSAGCMTCNEIERCAHTDADRHVPERPAVHMDPLLLLGIPKCNEQNVRTGRPNRIQQAIMVHIDKWSYGRRNAAHNLEPGVVL